jgi:hypothetical protein
MVVVSICYCSGEYNIVFYIAYDACTDQKLIFATFNNISVISWWSFLLEKETRVSGENHRPIASL